ncbi:MAG: hypothetical protein KF819_27750, partial [Labilithrix sp.]|nr:hypothetical protein [Labilithrix sp.]
MFRFAVGVVAALTLLMACDGAVEPAASKGDVDATTANAVDAESVTPSGSCVLTGAQCVSPPGGECCPPIGASRFDPRRNCRDRIETPFYCNETP